ncbi:hypothetical protein [Novosphingobium sp.]|uniref:hypothetical protein n=1 Tax=Novosphingobium sp. TaxID=1874826 RepID=UPI0035B3DCE3
MAGSRSRARTRGQGNQGNRRSEGRALFDDLLTMAGSLAESRREYASGQLETLADTIRQFSVSLPALPAVSTYAETAADSLEDLAGYVLDSDLPDMVSDAREIARRHPLATLGGSILAGLVITQLVQNRAGAARYAGRMRRAAGRRGRSRPPQAGDAP